MPEPIPFDEVAQPRGVPVASEVRDFKKLPPVTAFFTRGGVPGVRYAYILLSNLIAFQRRGWEQLNPPITFTVGEVALACLGSGKPIRGISTHSRRPELYIDRAAKQALGLLSEKEPSDANEEQSTAPVSTRQGREGDARVRGGQAPQR